MKISRLTAATGSAAVLAGLLVAPANAADDSFDGAARAMLQKGDIVPSLGAPAGYTFTAQRDTKPTPYLCSTGKGLLKARKAKHAYEAQYGLDKNPASQISQTLYNYGSDSAALAAWKDLKSKVKKCDADIPGGGGVPKQTVSNGTTKRDYEGQKGLWWSSRFGSKKNGESSTVVYYQAGSFIQALEYDKPLRSKSSASSSSDHEVAMYPPVPGFVALVALAIVLITEWVLHITTGM